ncbi:hypothetical protein ACFC0M_27260 [Streptomyces sp. NPDC056149]|uniref:hypothetical protein n=1 Tax=Streptomyces sp. NPDC056149 TaxID=3345728 RepID=UPI0035D62377
MREHRLVNNSLDGHVDGAVVQAGSIGFLSAPSNRVHNVFKEVRALNAVPMLYRTMVSLTALAALAGVRHGGTPLAGIAFVCDWLAIPAGWTEPVMSWIAERSDLVGAAAGLMLFVGLLALPNLRRMGWGLVQTLEWRAPSTVVLSFVVLVQCGYAWSVLLSMGVLAAFGVWVAWKTTHRGARSEQVLVAVSAVVLAVFFAPLYAFVWLLARDARSAPYLPDSS